MNPNDPLPAQTPYSGGGVTRRDALRLIGWTTAALAARLPVMAGPFTRTDFSGLVPEDKKLDPAWVRSLFERGTPEVLRGEALKYVGMPIGGVCAGQLYLGGDGRLWHWDLFNQPVRTGAGHYAKPPAPTYPVEQGFELRLAGSTVPLDATGFRDVSFRGEYPLGRVEYRDESVPLRVSLEAFSPFIPLNTDDSSLPATVLQFTVTNTSAATVTADLVGRLENAVLLHHRAEPGVRRCRIVAGQGHTFLACSAEPTSHATTKAPDFGTMGLALLGAPAEISSTEASGPISEKLTGQLGRKLTLAAGGSAVVTFVLAWHFPNLVLLGGRPTDATRPKLIPDEGRYYAARFADAAAVAAYCVEHFERLAGQTRRWRDTWYDSTLPWWLLDRTQLNTSILASSTCYRFASGRFWAWEGVGCCAGTCAHVWYYAHAMARQFPELERILREQVDFGLALRPDGAITFRGENNAIPAIDAQAGAILRALREHQMSADDQFLRRIWPGVRRATDWLIAKDGNGDGLIEGNQHNTLDSDWYGRVAWLSGLYLAALAAAAALADEMEDTAYAAKCRAGLARGQKNLVAELFDGDYFINRVDPKHLDAINSGTGCEIDQVMGQSWAFQVGLPRVLPEQETRTALRSLWKYNFTPDAGRYRERNPAGRWYAMAGEAGLLMCTFPRRDWDFEKASGEAAKKNEGGYAGYFNECMNGFEYQVASHMVWENMLLEGLAITRAVHDRYRATKRNPWNEVECGDHYARSMASYGVYLAACGFEYHGPKGRLAFAPRLTPEKFRAAFTAAEGWGSYSQQIAANRFAATVDLNWGSLRVSELGFVWAGAAGEPTATVMLGQAALAATLHRTGDRFTVKLATPARLQAGQSLHVAIT